MRLRHDECLLDDLFRIVIACDVFESDRRPINEYGVSQLGLELIVVLAAVYLIEQVQSNLHLILLIDLHLG